MPEQQQDILHTSGCVGVLLSIGHTHSHVHPHIPHRLVSFQKEPRGDFRQRFRQAVAFFGAQRPEGDPDSFHRGEYVRRLLGFILYTLPRPTVSSFGTSQIELQTLLRARRHFLRPTAVRE